MAQITGPIIAIIAGAAVGVRADRLHPRHLGQLFRQFAVTISVAMLISAMNALTLSPALCARVPAPQAGAARHHGAACSAASTACATAMRRSCAGCCASPFCRRRG